jgi:predicted alpha/beta superfamily hydrolase
LAGLRIDLNTNIGAYFGGLLGLVFVLYTLSCFVLWVSSPSLAVGDAELQIYAAGGVKVCLLLKSKLTGSTLPRLILVIEAKRLTWSKVI